MQKHPSKSQSWNLLQGCPSYCFWFWRSLFFKFPKILCFEVFDSIRKFAFDHLNRLIACLGCFIKRLWIDSKCFWIDSFSLSVIRISDIKQYHSSSGNFETIQIYAYETSNQFIVHLEFLLIDSKFLTFVSIFIAFRCYHGRDVFFYEERMHP
jgi:hypothetical protein